ncbi:MGH1-like glycoside hydrolase domain-containing protein [Actinoplanes utahensis]|uniref:MGH1-like glycoside hydrolase domain-containing protein n=1 Tax=Actinoplanes utahensis TaxID=1869 RepID=UPI000B2B4EDD|nr:hypothetical protein [Actinoplanes utahensis]GIF30666.1 hypothetical protein Aut01nite_36520 [Actinoplanes utahensis]
MSASENAEQRRLRDADTAAVDWRRWGPYLSERQWGTVREDYSEGGDAWDYLSHDQARSRAYRWGEDGIAGFSDDRQRLCLAVAMWNGRDPILKERFFGLTNTEGNHGEDVKEYWYYVDGTPTHSYMRMVYKYPQREFPYNDLVATNRARGFGEFEYELVDTGIFAEDRYFDVEIEYAKAGPEEILTRISVHNRGPEEATVHLLPTVWFRATGEQARLRTTGGSVVEAEHAGLGTRWWTCLGEHQLLFTENADGRKDAFGRYLIDGEKEAVNADGTGTKAAAVVTLTVPAGGTSVVRTRLGDQPSTVTDEAVDEIVAARRAEADEFYGALFAPALSEPERQVARQALAGMLWSKQYFGYDVERWLREHGRNPLNAPGIRNGEWFHLDAHDIISMPDKWEYPWFAAWDLAYHAAALSLVDVAFAKSQLELLLTRRYLHPNGQIPAYEWNFSDVNPPVHAWAAYLVYELEKARTGTGDLDFLERVFHKLSKNFTWWVNRKDMDGRNVFQGGFLGLDNIGVFDRSAPLPTGGHLDQADGTAWVLRRRPAVQRLVSARRVRERDVRRQLELAWPDLVPGQRPDDPGPAQPVRGLRRRLHRGMPDRFRPADDALRGGPGDLRPAHRHLPARRAGAPALLRRQRDVRPRALAGADAVLRVLPRRQRSRHRSGAPDRMDRAGRGLPEPVRRADRPGPDRQRDVRDLPQGVGAEDRLGVRGAGAQKTVSQSSRMPATVQPWLSASFSACSDPAT